MIKRKSEYIYEYIILIVSIVFCVCFFNNHCNLITDFGREVLIPVEILNGQVLYKDILNIYGPLSYYINALAVFLFGKNLNTFFITGSLNCIIFSLLIYKIGTKFFDKKLSLFSSLLISVYCMYGFGLYDFQHPYTYAVTYGLTFGTASVFYFIKYFETKFSSDLYFAALSAGLSACCKVEFMPFLLLYILILFIYECPIKKIFGFLLFLLLPFSVFCIPVVQGMTFEDVKYAAEIVMKEVSVPSVVNFSRLTGSYFSLGHFLNGVLSSFVSFVIFGVLFLLFKKLSDKKILFIVISAPFYLACLILFSGGEFAVLPIIIFCAFILFALRKSEPKYLILFGGALVCASKTLFSLNLTGYGTYTLPLLLLSLIVLLNVKPQTEQFIKFIVVFLIFVKLVPIIFLYQEYNFPVKTDKGTIRTSKIWAEGISEYINFVKSSTGKDDEILHLQEGALLNFLTDRKTDMLFYALNLPYIETYGIQAVINEINKFKYITVINGFGSYYFGSVNMYLPDNQNNLISDFIKNNYTPVYEYKNGNEIILLLKKNKF